MDVVSFAVGVWFGVCVTVTVFVVMGILSTDDDDDSVR